MNYSYIVSIFIKDRVGIIADVTKAIVRQGGDLGDLNQAVLNGYFTMIFIAEFYSAIDAETLKAEIKNIFVENGDEISLTVKPLAGKTESNSFDDLDCEENYYVMTVSSGNRKGLVSEVANFCRENQINILHLSTKVTEDDKYIMMYLIDLSSVTFLDVFRKKIRELEINRKLSIVLQHNDIFKATNEIKYYK
ncbi:MAG: ACT domain-containing protein [Victivallales bacterium]|nr:ACT domain-containing protein [Victivallales bacterium]MCF7888924.1 ACT domain-containing protein [Victivallales bacterium]